MNPSWLAARRGIRWRVCLGVRRRSSSPCPAWQASWRSLQDKLDSLRAHLGGLDFNYSDPYRQVADADVSWEG